MFRKIAEFFILAVGKIHWKLTDPLRDDELARIQELLKDNYYIILTHRKNHLSTFFTGFANFWLNGKWGYWAHALLNAEDEVNDKNDFKFIEAIGGGVTYNTFDKIFDVNGAVLLRPKSMSVEHWTYVMDKARSELGKPYDTLFDIYNDSELSCVELVRTALMAEPDYAQNFAHFEKMIAKEKNLTPDMFFDCEDFVVVYEIRR